MWRSVLLILIISLIIMFKIDVMRILGLGKTCVFSPLKLQLLLDNKPVSNTRVVRKWDWNNLTSDEAVTDINGSVSFPAVYGYSISRLLPIEIVIGQGLYVEIDGEEEKIWSNSRRSPEMNAEFDGKAFDVICELTQNEKLVEDYRSLMVTKCELRK